MAELLHPDAWLAAQLIPKLRTMQHLAVVCEESRTAVERKACCDEAAEVLRLLAELRSSVFVHPESLLQSRLGVSVADVEIEWPSRNEWLDRPADGIRLTPGDDVGVQLDDWQAKLPKPELALAFAIYSVMCSIDKLKSAAALGGPEWLNGRVGDRSPSALDRRWPQYLREVAEMLRGALDSFWFGSTWLGSMVYDEQTGKASGAANAALDHALRQMPPKARRVVEEVMQATEPIPLVDLALLDGIGWDPNLESLRNGWSTAQRQANKHLRPIGLKLIRSEGAAAIVSEDASEKTQEKRRKAASPDVD